MRARRQDQTLWVWAAVAAVFAGALGAAATFLRRSRSPSRLEELTREELYERAQAAGVEGRSSMTKDELIKALRAK